MGILYGTGAGSELGAGTGGGVDAASTVTILDTCDSLPPASDTEYEMV